jgi:hypothetical protein
VGGHVFISYRHDEPDSTYVHHLASFLAAAEVRVWFDSEIITGDRWRDVIRDHIDTCAAFVVVMTPAAEASVWVNREIARAEALGKPILPLLLSGAPFFSLADLQYDDVRNGQMPRVDFVAPVRTILGVASIDQDSRLQDRTKDALKATEAGVKSDELTWALSNGHWRDADILTDSVMVQAVGRKWNDWVRHHELASFPCSVLATIDNLWKHHSGDRFGFSVQRAIWRSLGMPKEPPKGDDDLERRFGDLVGWRVDGIWLDYEDYGFVVDSPLGHLPRYYCRHPRGWWLGRSFMVSRRLDECSIEAAGHD